MKKQEAVFYPPTDRPNLYGKVHLKFTNRIEKHTFFSHNCIFSDKQFVSIDLITTLRAMKNTTNTTCL